MSADHTARVMPRSNPTPDELERGAAQAIDTLTTLLRNLRQSQGELVEAGLLVGMDWPEIAQVTGHSSGDAARMAHDRWRAGQP